MTPTPVGFNFGLNPCQFELSQIEDRVTFQKFSITIKYSITIKREKLIPELKNSVNDDLESLFQDLQVGSKPHNSVQTFFLPKFGRRI